MTFSKQRYLKNFAAFNQHQQTPAVTGESYLPCHALNADSEEEVAGVKGD